MTTPAPVPLVPARRSADTHLLKPIPKTDPHFSKVSAAVAKNPQSTILLDSSDWNLRDPSVIGALPRNLTGLLLFGTGIDLAWLTAFPDLERLTLMGGMLNWEALGTLRNLRVLDLELQRLPDLSFLGDAPLEALIMNNCTLESLAHLSALSRLTQIDLHINVLDDDAWGVLETLTSLERARIHAYRKVLLPDLRRFLQLAYLSVDAPEIEFDPDVLTAAPVLQALALNGAPYPFLSRALYRADAEERWAEKLLQLAVTHPVLPSTTLKRVYLGTLRAAQRKTLAEWLHVPCVRQPEQLLKQRVVSLYDDRLEAQAEKKYDGAIKAMQKRVKAAIGEKCYVQFAAFEEDDAGLPTDNLDEVCWQGRCRVVRQETADEPGFESELLIDPTWLQLAQVANAMIMATNKETDHTFLESVSVVSQEGDVTRLELTMGS